jgi:hypothetical protein
MHQRVCVFVAACSSMCPWPKTTERSATTAIEIESKNRNERAELGRGRRRGRGEEKVSRARASSFFPSHSNLHHLHPHLHPHFTVHRVCTTFCFAHHRPDQTCLAGPVQFKPLLQLINQTSPEPPAMDRESIHDDDLFLPLPTLMSVVSGLARLDPVANSVAYKH